MGIAASIVSAVLKSVVGDKLGSGLINELAGISIDEASEKGINEIADFINGEKSKIDSILSEEKNDYVVTEIKDLFSKISITDEVLRQCRYDNMDLSAFLWNEYRECKNDYIECESEIKRCLFTVAEALIKLVRESENFEKDVLIHISSSVDGANAELQKISEYMVRNLGKLNADNQAILEILQIILKQNQKESTKNKDKKQKIKSRTQEYARVWNDNMFLNNFDELDEKKGVNIPLEKVYKPFHLPRYIWKKNENASLNLNNKLSQYMYQSPENRMLLILGQPGIGKSTLITWITANYKDIIDNILVYQFAYDLRKINWNNETINFDIGKKMIEELNLQYDNLNNKILILDGLDEISVESNRENIINKLYWGLVKKSFLYNFTLIITCRENYIHDLYKIDCDYIILQPWNKEQIENFCNIYGEAVGYKISDNMIAKLYENEKIFGIPLILYMILALNIPIEKEDSIVDVYDHIFSLEGGIYDRCIKGKSFGDKHRISTIKKQLHEISEKIAFWMFENEAEKAIIPQESYRKICDEIIKKYHKVNMNIKQDFMIANFFELKHTEGKDTEQLCFVHRSIYEYFVAEMIYNSIENNIETLSQSSQIELAENIVVYLKKGQIGKTIGEYLQHKIIKKFNQMNKESKEKFYQWWEDTVIDMMNNGMFYYCSKKIFDTQDFKELLYSEVQCFLNLVEILRLLLKTSKRRFIMQDANIDQLAAYIKYCSLIRDLNIGSIGVLDFSVMWLKNIKLPGVNLKEVNLKGTNLVNANLERSDLYKANLNEADLKDANLKKASLDRAYLEKAYLNGAKLYKVSIEKSYWLAEDIKRILPQLKNMNFTLIYQNRKKLYRKEIFPTAN